VVTIKGIWAASAEDACGAFRASGVANRAAMEDEVQMEGEGAARGDGWCDVGVGLLGGHLWGQKTEAFEDALDMGVDGKHVLMQGEQKDASRGLPSDAVKLEEFSLGRLGGDFGKIPEVQRAAAGDGPQDLLDAAPLGLCETARMQGGFEFSGIGDHDIFPSRKRQSHGVVCGTAVLVICVLRENCGDEGIQGILAPGLGLTVLLDQ